MTFLELLFLEACKDARKNDYVHALTVITPLLERVGALEAEVREIAGTGDRYIIIRPEKAS